MIKFRLKELLNEKDINQKQLFEITGIRPSTISAYYNNTAKSISLENMNLICTALNCEIQDFIIHSNNICNLENLHILRNTNNSDFDEIDSSLLLKEFIKIFDKYNTSINRMFRTTAAIINNDFSNNEDLSSINKDLKLNQEKQREYLEMILKSSES